MLYFARANSKADRMPIILEQKQLKYLAVDYSQYLMISTSTNKILTYNLNDVLLQLTFHCLLDPQSKYKYTEIYK